MSYENYKKISKRLLNYMFPTAIFMILFFLLILGFLAYNFYSDIQKVKNNCGSNYDNDSVVIKWKFPLTKSLIYCEGFLDEQG